MCKFIKNLINAILDPLTPDIKNDIAIKKPENQTEIVVEPNLPTDVPS